MKTHLVFDCIMSDRIYFEAGQKIHAGESFNLFTTNDSGVKEEIITDQKEEQTLKWLMSTNGGNLLLDKLGCVDIVS